MTLSNPSNATLGAASVHTYTIVNDDFILSRSSLALSHSPLVGAISETSVNVWMRATANAAARVQYQVQGADWSAPLQSADVNLIAPNDYTGVASLTGLSPVTTYEYRVLFNNEIQSGLSTFKTLPARGGTGSQFSFAFGADISGTVSVYHLRHYWKPSAGFCAAPG